MSRLPCPRVALVLLALATLASPVRAQDDAPRPSQHAAVAQTVNRTEILLEYDRPVARGRELFGGIVEWDVVWTPGANRATWIDLSTSVRVEGQDLGAGRYGVWLIPHESAPWEVIFVEEWDTHHGYFPFETEALRLRVAAESGAHMEALAAYFPAVGPYETTLRFHWGETVLPLRIEVPR